MRAEKQLLTKEYTTRLNASPFFIVVDYKSLKVEHLTELRQRKQKWRQFRDAMDRVLGG